MTDVNTENIENNEQQAGKREPEGVTVIDLYNSALALSEALEIMGPDDYPTECGGKDAAEFYYEQFRNAIRLDTLREVLQVLGIAGDDPTEPATDTTKEATDEDPGLDKWKATEEPLADLLENYAEIYENEGILSDTVLPAIYGFLERIRDINDGKLAEHEIDSEGLRYANTRLEGTLTELDDLQTAFHGHGCESDHDNEE